MRITFLGAAQTVTGSKYLLDDGADQVLIDCGLFQGTRELRAQNWEGADITPRKLRAVLLTHAHLDHSGYIPKLVKDGFRGPIYCSEPTLDLAKILLPDSGRLQEEDAEQANKYGYTKHAPALPLYTEEDAQTALRQFHPVPLGTMHHLLNTEFSFSLHRAGHILGATFIKVMNGGTSVLFSGDIGRANDPVMVAPAQIQDADYIVVESTYGDRLHTTDNPSDEIAEAVNKTIARNGTVVIPAFAVGRAQMILYYIHKLKQEGRIPRLLPVYLDSPMAIDATKLLHDHPNEHRMPKPLCNAVCASATYVQTREASKALDTQDPVMPSIIISASGMATGGRVLHHLKRFAPDPRNTILLVGYQAAGTRGARLAAGEKELKIHGDLYPVKARVVMLDSMSAHADYAEVLDWLSHFTSRPRRVFVTHGEQQAAESLRDKITQRFGWDAIVPEYLYNEDI